MSGILLLRGTPPDGLPVCGVLAGPDDATFCQRVGEAIGLGYELHEGPAVAFNGEGVIVAQAPLGELQNYSNELKSMTGGAGPYTMDYSHHENTPPPLPQEGNAPLARPGPFLYTQ